ncbi:vacuolar protein sorting-associated protein 54 isoform X2 [Ciona intestinalis]
MERTLSINERWCVHDSKVNLAALLNDPRKVRRDHDLFTKTWGEAFRALGEASSIPRSKYIPNVVRGHFNDYLDETRDGYLRHESKSIVDEDSMNDGTLKLQSAAKFDEKKRALRKSSATLNAIPKIFLHKDFSMMIPTTFTSVLNSQDTTNSRKESSSSKLLQEKLSHYLDMVEVAIARQISVQSEAFFKAMSFHEKLHEYLNSTLVKTQQLLLKTQQIRSAIVTCSLRVVQLHRERTNSSNLLTKLHLMVTVHQTQPTIQLLLSTNEYAGSLDLIRTTQDVLHQELNGIQCFRHLGCQLTEMERVIGQMMKQEMEECFKIEMNRPISDGHTCSQPHRVTAVTLGLLRLGHFDFIDGYREEIESSVKRIIKDIVCDAVNQHCDVIMEHETLASKMRMLDFKSWIEMLDCVFDALIVFLRRIKTLIELVSEVGLASVERGDTYRSTQGKHKEPRVVDVPTNHVEYNDANNPFIDDSMDDLASYEDELVATAAHCYITDDQQSSQSSEQNETETTSSYSEETISSEDFEKLSKVLRSTLCWVVGFQHDRCVKILLAKGKDNSLDKLKSSEFLVLAKSVKRYTNEADALISPSCGDNGESTTTHRRLNNESCAGINGPLGGAIQSQASRFISRFHDERKNKLSLILDNEVWKQAEVPPELSLLLQNLVDGKLSSSEHEVTRSNKSCELLVLDDRRFAVVGTVLMLLKMVSEYCRCCDDLPMSATDLVHRLRDLLTFFNSRTCQLVLGAGALQLVGLKTITTKHLSLASQCLELVLYCLPSIRTHFESQLMKVHHVNDDHMKHRAVLRHFDHVAKIYQEHIMEIENKLLAIVENVVTRNLKKWEVKAPVPSSTMRNVCKQICKFHETIRVLLPEKQTKGILIRLNNEFKRQIHDSLTQWNIRNDGGPQHGLVAADLKYYELSIKGLPGIENVELLLQTVWDAI